MFLRKALDIYKATTPSLSKIEQLIGKDYVVDHVAFRTFKSAGGIESISRLLRFDYNERDEYKFPEKKLTAKWFSPKCSFQPRIFVSQLEDNQLTGASRKILKRNIPDLYSNPALFFNQISYQFPTDTLVNYADYENLRSESDYAAWTLINGPKLNHVALSLHSFPAVSTLLNLHDILQKSGFNISTEGGSVKISEDGLLAQSSIVSDELVYRFLGEQHPISKVLPGTFVEFIDRHKEGFEAGNAFHIFESTSHAKLPAVEYHD